MSSILDNAVKSYAGVLFNFETRCLFFKYRISYTTMLQQWTDDYIQWDPSLFGGTDSVIIPRSFVWTPDVIITNR
jgi:hypothetical protein